MLLPPCRPCTPTCYKLFSASFFRPHLKKLLVVPKMCAVMTAVLRINLPASNPQIQTPGRKKGKKGGWSEPACDGAGWGHEPAGLCTAPCSPSAVSAQVTALPPPQVCHIPAAEQRALQPLVPAVPRATTTRVQPARHRAAGLGPWGIMQRHKAGQAAAWCPSTAQCSPAGHSPVPTSRLSLPGPCNGGCSRTGRAGAGQAGPR